MLPRSAAERLWFAGVCLSAGMCEEMVFHGFLIPYVALCPRGVLPRGAVALAAVVFAGSFRSGITAPMRRVRSHARMRVAS